MSITYSSMGTVTAFNYYNSQQRTSSTDSAFTDLGSALSSSNLTVAKDKSVALQASLQSDLSNSTSSPSAQALRALSDNLNLVTKAIADGNTSVAQTAFSKLKSTYSCFRSVILAPSVSSSLTTSLVSQLFGGSSSRSSNNIDSTWQNITTLMNAYASPTYYRASDGTIQQSTSTASTYNATA